MKFKFFYPLVLVILVLAVSLINYHYFGSFLYDCGREFLVPEAVLDGNTPIKEVFISYFPLSYQINALLFKIFGSNLNTLRFAGLSAQIIAVIFAYFCALEFVPEKKAFFAALCTCFIPMFNVSLIFNYITPYSYAFVYSVSILFVSLFLALQYIKNGKFLYLSYLLFGFCFALKSEFIFILIPYLIMLIYKKTPPKNILIAHFVWLLPAAASFLALGFNLADFISYIEFLKKFISSSILKTYNAGVFMTNPADWFVYNFKSLLLFSGLYLVSFVILYLPIKKQRDFLTLFFGFGLFFVLFVWTILIGQFAAHQMFAFLPAAVVFVLIKSKNFSLGFLALVSIFLSLRFNLIYSNGYLAYIMPIGILVFVLYFTEFIKSENFKKINGAFLLIISFLNIFYFTLSNQIIMRYQIKTPKGNINTASSQEKEFIEEILLYLGSLDEDQTVLILPEGMMFNYLSSKKTDYRYYQLLPNHIEILGEDNIIAGLSLTPPDYIFITSFDYSIYGTPRFCADFGQKICKFTKENYEHIKTFGLGHVLQMEGYKRKY